MIIENWNTLIKLVGEDLAFYLYFTLIEKFEEITKISEKKLRENYFKVSILSFFFKKELERSLENYLQASFEISDPDRVIKEANRFFEKMILKRDSFHMASYLDYLESWISQNELWLEDRPIPFEKFEFI